MAELQNLLAGSPRRTSLRMALAFTALAVLSAVVVAGGNGVVYATTALMTACVGLPAFHRWQQRTFDAFDTFFVVGSLNVVGFGLGAIWTVNDPALSFDKYVVPFVPLASFYALLGVAAMGVGYHIVGGRQQKAPAYEDVTTSTLFLVLVGGTGMLGMLAATEIAWLPREAGVLVRTIGQLGPLFLFAWALIWLIYFSGQATAGQRRALFMMFLPGFALIAANSLNDKSMLMSLAGIPVIARWYTRRHLPWKSLLVLLLILIFVVFPVVNTYRLFDPHMSEEARAEGTLDTLTSWDRTSYIDHSIGSFQSRLAAVNMLAAVVRDVPRWVPYAKGKTIIDLLPLFIPRVFWPDKPVFRMGRTFGETFRVVGALDEETNVAVTVPGELYWNFSWPGIVVGMMLLGMLMRWLYRRYAEAAPGATAPVRRAIHIVVLISFVHLGGGLAVEIMGILRLLLLLEILRWSSRYLGLLRRVPVGESVGP